MKKNIYISILILSAIALGIGAYTYNSYQQKQEAPWIVFQQYANFIKAHDLTGANSVSYNQQPPCTETEEECNSQFDYMYSKLSSVRKDEYVNRWEDDKQIILITDAKKNDTGDTRGYIKSNIYFVKGTDGKLKVLSVSTGGGWSQSIVGTTLTEAGIDAELQLLMLDTDKDGLTDQRERCEGASQFFKCSPTDPLKRDTNGNGWWDGIEAKFK